MLENLIVKFGPVTALIGLILWFFVKILVSRFFAREFTKYREQLHLKTEKEFDLYMVERDRYEKFVEEIENIFRKTKGQVEGASIDMQELKVLFYKMALSIPDETIRAIKGLMAGQFTEKQKVKVYIELRKALLANVNKKTELKDDDIPEDFTGTIIKKK